jgi:hypothetical protein
LVPKKLGIGEAWTDHALVATAHRLRVTAGDVADGDEVRQQATVVADHREVLLVALHRRDQRLGRHVQETRLETPGQSDRPLDQGGDLVEQRRLDHRVAAE